MVERNMCNAVMRGIVVPPGSRARLRHSSCEADKQSGAIRCGAIRGGDNRGGVGGAKGGDQGECGPASARAGLSAA
jgi:hypothetical protein